MFWFLILFVAWFIYRHVSWIIGTVTFKDKTVLITGASSGIGEALVKEICNLGARKIIVAARRVNELERVKKVVYVQRQTVCTEWKEIQNPDGVIYRERTCTQ